MESKFYKETNEFIKYVIIVARYKDSFVFCKHKDRTTYELPGGHVEEHEDILTAAKRELEEETGAIAYDIKFISYYSYDSYWALYYAEIQELGELKYEIESLYFADYMPANITYPHIQPRIFQYIVSHADIKFSSNYKRMIAGALYSSSKNDLELHRSE